MNGHVERATYTYAIARPFHPSHLWGVRGVDCTAVHLVHHGELAAVVGTLSLTKADEAALRARLESPAELATIARAHHGVVNAVFEHSVTLPFRLATIHQSEQRVVENLRTGHELFCSALAQLDGRVEVGVKIYSDVVASSLASVGSGDGAHSDGSADPGRDYLCRRRQQLHDRDEARRRTAAAAARIGDTLARLSVDHRYHNPQDPRLSGVTEENVLNAAYLIDGASIDAFAAFARSLEVDRAATRVELTGPWPPYSFIEPIDPPCSADVAVAR